MAALGTWAENAIINALLRNTSFTPPTTVWLALYLTNPTALNTGTEVSTSGGSNYSRQPISFGPPSGGVIANSGEVDFPEAGANWGNVVYAGVLDAATSGNLLFFGTLVVPRYIATGDIIKFLIGSVTVTVT